MRVLTLLLAIPLFLAAANVKLYTVDGQYQIVREYHVEGDRVRFYSIDRGDWEEVPVSIVDLKKTDAEAGERRALEDRQDKQEADETAAARAERAELASIPMTTGVYRIEDGRVRAFPAADFKVHTAGGRSALQVLSPLPIIPGKATVEIAGDKSPNVVRDDRPEFYFRMDGQEAFGIVKLKVQKGLRIAETIDIMPISKEMEETRDPVAIFSKQLPGDDFFRIWPQESLPKGEYAVIEYIDGKVELRLWDFRIE